MGRREVFIMIMFRALWRMENGEWRMENGEWKKKKEW
jgi:hypothetical protein